MELETDEWPRHMLEYLIKVSCEKDVSVNEVINDVLTQFLEATGHLDDEQLSDEEFAEEMREDLEREELERAEYGSTHKEFAESMAADKYDDEFDDGLAFLPMNVFTKLERIIGEYDARKKTLGHKTEPNLRSMAEFLAISYGSPFTESQVRAVIEMKKQEESPVKEGMVNLNFHQRVQNIIFGSEKLEEELGRVPSVWELTDALNNGGIDVQRNHVSAILEIDAEGKKKCCEGRKYC